MAHCTAAALGKILRSYILCQQLLDELFVISKIILTQTLIILDITKTNLIIVLSYIEQKCVKVMFLLLH